MRDRKIDLLHEEMPERATTFLLRKRIMDVLMRHYPHLSRWPDDIINADMRSPWLIDIRDFKTGGIITIRNLLLSGNMGVTVKLTTIQGDPDLKIIVRYVGELLERYNITRRRALDVREQIYGMKRDFRGHAVAQT